MRHRNCEVSVLSIADVRYAKRTNTNFKASAAQRTVLTFTLKSKRSPFTTLLSDTERQAHVLSNFTKAAESQSPSNANALEAGVGPELPPKSREI